MATTLSVVTPLTSAGVESLLTTLMERFETIRTEQDTNGGRPHRVPMQAEIRSLDFWRSIVAECLASFFLIFIVCGSFVPWSGHTPPAIGIALAAGFAVASLTLSFAHISGAHLNPVVTLALLITRKVSPMKAFLFVTSQGGGAIAGAALLYGVTTSGHQGNLGATIISAGLSDWQALGIELCLTFVIVLVYLTTMDDHRRALSASIGPGPLTLGLAYTACSFVALPSTGASFNPMRSLGPAFVMNKWDSHWVYWLGPIVGGCLAGILYEFIFNPFRNAQRGKGSVADGDNSSIHSDEDNYDDLKSTAASNYQSARSQHYDQYRPAICPGGPSNPVSPSGAVGNNWRNQQRMERAESVYGGTKSLYHCGKSPAPTRAATNLNRSQSVYAKPPSNPVAVGQGGGGGIYNSSRPAQLQSAQSTYIAARNVDLIRTESIYATRPAPVNPSRIAPNESIYGQTRRTPAQMMMSPHDVEGPRNEMLRSPRGEPLYNGTGNSHQQQQHDRSQPETYQLEPIYQTRREVVATVEPSVQRTENIYGRKVPAYRPETNVTGSAFVRPSQPSSQQQQQQQEQMETSATSVAPISPSDTSKDSAYGSVHGTSAIQSPAEWPNTHQIQSDTIPAAVMNSYNQQQQQLLQQQLQATGGFHPHAHGAFQPPTAMNGSSSSSNGQQHSHVYAQKFRADLLSPNHHLHQQHSPSHTPGSFHSPVQY